MLISRIINVSLQGKIALKSLLQGWKFLATPVSNDPMRDLLNLQNADIENLRRLQYEVYRIPPSILTSSITKCSSLLINPANFCLENASKSLILDLHEIIEGNIDESLILMNEAEIEEKDLRKILCEMRDNGHDVCERIKRGTGVEGEGYGKLLYKPYFWAISTWL